MEAGREAAAEEAELRREEQRLAALAVQESKRRHMPAGAPVPCFTGTQVQILRQRGLAAEKPGHWKWRQRIFLFQKCNFFGGAQNTQESRRALEMEAIRATATAFTTAEKLLLLRLLLQRSSLEMEATRATATAFTHLLLL